MKRTRRTFPLMTWDGGKPTGMPVSTTGYVLIGDPGTEQEILRRAITSIARDCGWEWFPWALSADQDKEGAFKSLPLDEPVEQLRVFLVETQLALLQIIIEEQRSFYTVSLLELHPGFPFIRDSLHAKQRVALVTRLKQLGRAYILQRRSPSFDFEEASARSLDAAHPQHGPIHIQAIDLVDLDNIRVEAWQRHPKTEKIRRWLFPVGDFPLVDLNRIAEEFAAHVSVMEGDNETGANPDN